LVKEGNSMGKKDKTEKKKSEEKNHSEDPIENGLRTNLEEIKTYEDVIGYILRNSTSATIDLKEPTKIIDYALLSSSVFDASEALIEEFQLGDLKNIIIEGKNAQMLSLIVNKNKTSVFMQKGANWKEILDKIE
jgi:predicted regulator of Ras-like GTPase activity (Roadblock/LC7/MglB family)